MLKYQKTCQIILLILGVSMISYGAVTLLDAVHHPGLAGVLHPEV